MRRKNVPQCSGQISTNGFWRLNSSAIGFGADETRASRNRGIDGRVSFAPRAPASTTAVLVRLPWHTIWGARAAGETSGDVTRTKEKTRSAATANRNTSNPFRPDTLKYSLSNLDASQYHQIQNEQIFTNLDTAFALIWFQKTHVGGVNNRCTKLCGVEISTTPHR